MNWLFLTLAIGAEVVATTALKTSDGFTRLGPAALAAAGYAVAFYFLALTLRTIPVGVAYAIWSGVGIVAITVIGYIRFRQHLDLAALIGIALIVVGVIVLQVFSDFG